MKKGISPMIAAVMLIGLTVLVSIIVMNWTTTLVKTQGDRISNKSAEGIQCTSASVNIQQVHLDFGSNRSTVIVENDGLNDDTIESSIMLSKNGTISPNLTAFPVSIKRGAITSVTFNLTGTLSNCANFSQAVVRTSCTSDKFDSTAKCT